MTKRRLADNVTAIEYPVDGFGWPRVVFADGSVVAAFMAPDREPVRILI